MSDLRAEWITVELARAEMARSLGLDQVAGDLDSARAAYLEAVRRYGAAEAGALMQAARGHGSAVVEITQARAAWRTARSDYERVAEAADAAMASSVRGSAGRSGAEAGAPPPTPYALEAIPKLRAAYLELKEGGRPTRQRTAELVGVEPDTMRKWIERGWMSWPPA